MVLFGRWFTLKEARRVLGKEESAVISAKNRRIDMLVKELDALYERLDFHIENAKEHKEFDIQDRVITAIEKKFFPETQNMPSPPPPKGSKAKAEVQERLLESGKEYSDEQINEFLDRFSRRKISHRLSKGRERFFDDIKSYVPDISETSLKRIHELAVAKVSD